MACRNQLCQGQCGGFCGGCCLEDKMSHIPGPNQGQETNLFNLSVVNRTFFECGIEGSTQLYMCQDGKCVKSVDGTGISLSECSKVIQCFEFRAVPVGLLNCCILDRRCASQCHCTRAILPVFNRCASKRAIHDCLECHYKNAWMRATQGVASVCRMRVRVRSTAAQS